MSTVVRPAYVFVLCATLINLVINHTFRLRVTSIDTMGQWLEQIGVNGDKYVWQQKHLDHRKTPGPGPQTLTRLGAHEQPVTEPAQQRGANRNTCQNTGGQTVLARAGGDEF